MLEATRTWISYAKSRFRDDRLGSSLSDNDAYPTFCSAAAGDDTLFVRFRNAPGYSEILEHVSFDLGGRYLRCISEDAQLLEAAARICSTDQVGSPNTFIYPGLGSASPTTLRYLKVARDLEESFGPWTGKRIVEIGVGYGGQCRVLCELASPASYTLVDLEPVLRLVRRFLAATGTEVPARFYDPDSVPSLESDLLISNYAFSELRREAQEAYMALLVDNAKSGYMTFNRIAPKSFRSMPVEEFAERVGGVISPERPRSYPGNRIVRWERTP